MLLKWWRQPPRNRTIETIYGVIVAQARSAGFLRRIWRAGYRRGPVRHDRIAFVPAPAPDQRARPRPAQSWRRPLFDRFCGDLDGNLREMGVGDLTVPKRMQKFAEAFYGRSAAYEQALAAGDRDAASAGHCAQCLWAGVRRRSARRQLADYMFRRARGALDAHR